jgi:hypothetical protein
MNAATKTTTTINIVSRWDATQVLYSYEAMPEQVASGLAVRVALGKATFERAVLRGADLSEQKADFFDVLLRAPREISGLRLALVEGRIDGSVYTGACACLVGTIANVRGCGYDDLGGGLVPNAGRPIERFFTAIKKGDTPQTNQVSALVVGWLDEFTGLLSNATAKEVAA